MRPAELYEDQNICNGEKKNENLKLSIVIIPIRVKNKISYSSFQHYEKVY